MACSPNQQNIGFISSLNWESLEKVNETAITFAHEIRHSYGAIHDTETCNDNQALIIASLIYYN
jgi:hypothetical protein